MKILAVAEFDPAGVLTGHREALRALGVDYRLVVRDVYAEIPVKPDWVIGAKPDIDAFAEVYKFAHDADVLQFHPSIGQPHSYSSSAPFYDDGEADERWPGILWRSSTLFKRARRVSLFHGSRNAAANAEAYAEHWRGFRKHAIWATTLDYAHRMGAAYAPPAVCVDIVGNLPIGERGSPRAPMRNDDDPLIIVQAPTDPDNCHTAVLLAAARAAGCVVDLVQGRPRLDVWRRKARAHAGFDHLRGSFSVNTVENLAIGLAPLVGLRPEYRELLGDLVPPDARDRLFPFWDEAGFGKYLRALVADPALTRRRQTQARICYDQRWRPELIGARLKKMYEAL